MEEIEGERIEWRGEQNKKREIRKREGGGGREGLNEREREKKFGRENKIELIHSFAYYLFYNLFIDYYIHVVINKLKYTLHSLRYN